jgi:hypothetical protein
MAQLDGDIVRFRQLKDWQSLVHAVDDKINEQVAFVEWWDTDGPGANYGGNRTKVVLGRPWSVARANDEFGFDASTVSRWRKWTSDHNQEKYRENLILGMRRRAGLEPDENHRAQCRLQR